MNSTEPDSLTSTLTLAFSYKTGLDHAKGFLAKPVQLITVFVACFLSMWGILEASEATFNINPNRFACFIFLVIASITIAIAWRGYTYLNTTPPGLEELSRAAQRIAHLQRPRWEFRFAKSVLATSLGSVDQECRNLLDRKEYVPANRPANIREYISLAGQHPDNMIRMAETAKRLIVLDLPRSLQSTPTKPASPAAMINVASQLRKVYVAAVEHERMVIGILPPNGFEKLHNLQIGWSQPIRDAIVQVFDFLQRICELDYNAESQIKYEIEFKECPNVERFCLEMDRLEKRLPELMSNEHFDL